MNQGIVVLIGWTMLLVFAGVLVWFVLRGR